LEESLLEVSIATSSPIEQVADMDALSFVALSEVVARVSNRRRYEAAWTAMLAAQGTKEGMDNLTKPWKPETDAKDGNDLMRDVGSF
jgi:hypothetical protein